MKSLIASAFVLTALAAPAMADPHDVFATFATEEGTSHIQIADCGDGSPCGTIVWIDPTSMPEGVTPQTAVGKTGDNVLGMTMLKGFERKKSGWRNGTVYDPENDKTYAARLARLDNGDLQLKGCVGPFCQTQVWTQVNSQLASNN